MDRLWTPWRFEYLRNADHATECVFCGKLRETRDAANLLLFRGRNAFVILNLFPYTSGHLLVVANRHIASLSEATPEEAHEIVDLARICEHALRQEYHPDGFNMGFNLGRAAGAGVEHHLHMHVLPRWTGDSNFVSVVGETRVLPEELPTTFQRLFPYFNNP
ncbi:MAG: HIT domain-containing protein [Acidobacteriota bacterium]|jgi:ATP adenylyltransferase|nr:HIT domain-containing protein [Acidobacteriota bacterium]